LVQLDQADQVPTWQSTAHASVRHAWFWNVVGQGVPPAVAWRVMERERDWRPPPHETGHVDQAPQALTVQLDGHACWLQALVSCSDPHTLPP
jgi:hypothetical protein